jgi:hypothetical protein
MYLILPADLEEIIPFVEIKQSESVVFPEQVFAIFR